MIHDVDETLRAIVRRDVINGSDIEVLFDAPTKDWASRRNAPTIDIYLYDIREDLKRRETGQVFSHDERGRKTGVTSPPRFFKLSYLITAWTQRPEDEHRLLSAMLACFLRNDRIPGEWVAGTLGEQGWPIDVTIALPPPEDRALSDVWSALGGELKPSLDLVCLIPLDTGRMKEAAMLVDKPPAFDFRGPENQEDSVQGKIRPEPTADELEAAAVLANDPINRLARPGHNGNGNGNGVTITTTEK
jgi:hypothetical protein